MVQGMDQFVAIVLDQWGRRLVQPIFAIWTFCLDHGRGSVSGMRKEIYRMADAEALAVLARSPVVHLATTDAEGGPILRTVHGVVVDGALAFHGAPAGEKIAALGRPVVAGAEETIAVIPSYFFDPTLACPATTYYRSAQLHGVLEEVTDRHAKARVLAALMAKYQPEGGHAPVDADDPRYRKQVEGILVVQVGQARIDGKGKFGQNRKPEELLSVLTQLWKRGLGGDPGAIEALRRAHPQLPAPEFLRAPAGLRMCCAMGPGSWRGRWRWSASSTGTSRCRGRCWRGRTWARARGSGPTTRTVGWWRRRGRPATADVLCTSSTSRWRRTGRVAGSARR